jgi:hypothetical protein
MRLAAIELFGLGALSGVKLSLGDTETRRLTVLFGGDGVGKTTALGAIASTRPGHAIPLLPRRRLEAATLPRAREGEAREVPFAVSEWMLGDDDPERPHPLRVVSPNAPVPRLRRDGATLTDDDGETALRRREQALFDKRAQERGGHAFAAFSGLRWFSRSPVLLATPERTVLRYDVRAAPSFDDATRADLTRELKQVLAVAGVGAALEERSGKRADMTEFDAALREAAALVLGPFGAEYDGIHPRSLEPVFAFEGRDATFEDLPRGARHLLAIVALSVRTLVAAYPESERPVREREGVVLVDDVEANLDASVLRHVPAMLKAVLPRVQWILTTSAAAITLGCERDEVVALRRDPEEGRVVVHEGAFAVLH